MYTLSASKIKTILGCRRKFYYRYIQNEEDRRHPAAYVGSAVHKAIELGYTTGERNPFVLYSEGLDQTQNDYQSRDSLDKKLYNDGLLMVSKFDFDKRTPIYLEREFRLPFPDADWPIAEIHGYMDHVFDGGIVDLKSSRNRPPQDLLNNDIQFGLYAWAYEQLWGEMPKFVYWHHLRTSEDLEFRGHARLDNMISTVQHIVDDLDRLAKRGQDDIQLYPQTVDTHCSYCSFRGRCL